jgi:hypothetical protein
MSHIDKSCIPLRPTESCPRKRSKHFRGRGNGNNRLSPRVRQGLPIPWLLAVTAMVFNLSASVDQMPAPFKRSKIFLAGKPAFYLINHVFAI